MSPRLQKRLLPFAVLALVGVSIATWAAGQPRSERTPTEQAHRLVAEGATLLDVRSPAEHALRHLPGSRLIPVDELASRVDELPRERPVVVYCASGRRSAHAAALLTARGFTVHDLGGMPPSWP